MPHCTEKNTLEYHTVAGSCKTESICKGGTLRMGIFFDGTGNDDAVAEEYSNVKKLFDVYTKKALDVEKKTDIVSAYVRGVGSRQSANVEAPANIFEKVDRRYIKIQDGTGGSLGTGGHARINHMIYALQEAIKTFKADTKFYPQFIEMDIFGFSRGAIQARHFVNVIKQGFYTLNGPYSDYKPSDFTIKTLNIFDSVSSFNATTVLKPGTPLDLSWAYHIKEGWVTKIIHFMADDEYRIHFDGQTVHDSQDLDYPHDIVSASRTELVFLGAHSDIGGGYRVKHHGCNNNDLAKIYLNKMYDMAKINGVPFEGKPKSNSWRIPEELNQRFLYIQSYYKRFPKLKVAHKKFRERIAYLNDYNSGRKIMLLERPSDLENSIQQNKREITQLLSEIASLQGKMWGVQGSRRLKMSQELEELKQSMSKLITKNHASLKQIKAHGELRKVFNEEQDYLAFVSNTINFHNTYVHKSHSAMLGADDHDADGNVIGDGRDLAMSPEVDGYFTWYLHRHVYQRKYDNVTKKLCEQENAKKSRSFNLPTYRDVINYTNYRWATPDKLSI